jgi:iron(III) transport system permease protein
MSGAALVATGPARFALVGRRLLAPGNLLPSLLLASVLFLVVYPLAMVIYASLTSSAPGESAALSLAGWRAALADRSTYQTFSSTLAIAIPRSALALALAGVCAWIIGRTNTPLRSLLDGMIAFMFFLPELPWVIAWQLLGAPGVGYLNQWLHALVPGAPLDLINVYSYTALIVLGAVRLMPMLYLLIGPALLAMDANLEEASRMSGASGLQTMMRINLPLILPALLSGAILALVRSMESFEMEQILGEPARIYVFTTRIYLDLYGNATPDYGVGLGLAVILLLFTLGLLGIQPLLIGGRHFTTVSGKGYRSRPIDLGAGRWFACSAIVVFFLIFGLLPFVILALNSLTPVTGFLSPALLGFSNWSAVLSTRSLIVSIGNTLTVSVSAATLGVAMCAVIAYITTRTKWPGRRLLGVLAWLPWGVPGLVMALGFLWAFVSLPIFGTLWLLILVYLTRGLPLGARFFASSMVQIGGELEESSRVHGASWLRTFLDIWAPLLRPAAMGAWIVLFVLGIRVLDSAILLAGPGTRVLAVDIFMLQLGGQPGQASVLALIQTCIIAAAAIVLRLVSGQSRLMDLGRR